jgi:ankyrin repeat protein
MLETLRQAIAAGDLDGARAVVATNPGVVNERSADNERTPLHTVADYPGHRVNGLEIAQLLIASGADVNARFQHPKIETSRETPLHWAASNNDVDLATLLLNADAQIDIDGGVIENCTPLWDATIFGGTHVCNLLIKQGAHCNLMSAAAAGRRDLVERYFDTDGGLNADAGNLPGGRDPVPLAQTLDSALGFACAGGHASLARFLLDRGGDPTWASPGGTAIERATANAHGVIVDFLAARGYKAA